MSERHESHADTDIYQNAQMTQTGDDIHPDLLYLHADFMRKFDDLAAKTRDQARELAGGEPQWNTIELEPVLSRSQQVLSAIRDTVRYVSGTTGDAAHFILDIPHDQSVGSNLKGLPSEAIEIARGTTRTTHEVLTSLSEQTGITPRRALAAAVVAGVLASTVAHQPNGVEVAAGKGPIPDALIVNRHADYAAIAFNPKGQDVARSISVAANVSGIPVENIVFIDKDNELRFIGSANNASDEQILAAAIAAQRSEGETKLPEAPAIPTSTEPAQTSVAPESPSLQPEFIPLPKSPEEMTDTEYIDWLVSNVHPSAEKYAQFSVDTSREDVFKDELSGRKITPQAFVGHWTAGTYKNGVDQFVSAIKNREGNCCSVMYFMDKDAKVYRFTDSWEMTAHAAGANSFTQGVEIEAADLKGYTPQQMEAFVYLAYRFLDANDLPISRETFLGHAEVDAEHGNNQKIDMPSELVDKLLPKLQQLATDLSGKSNPSVPESGTQQPFDAVMSRLLDEIASHEGGWDSLNTGVAGDTRLGGEKYQQLLSGRKLSELTISEVLDLQDRGIIMAVGRYQFIPGTLRSAVAATGIDVSRPFDQAAQNELAINYLILGGKRPSLAAYIKGESDGIEKAVNDLCKEWASFPCIDGTGFYDGDSAGNNAAGGLQRVQEISKLLNDIRAAYAAKENPSQISAPTPPASSTTQTSTTVVATAGDTTEASLQPSTTQAAAEDAPVQDDKPQEVRVVDGLFSEEAARNIYKIWFTDKNVVDGQEVEVVDEEALDAWMKQLPTEKTTNGEERYVISFDNLPERK